MAAILKENYNDPLEYARNLKQLGMSEEMATYQARNIAITFINFYTTL